MEYLIKPWAHQEKAIAKSYTEPNLALLFEMGVGKTGTAINILRGRYEYHKRVLRTLILAPLVVTRNWKDEFALHSRIDPKDILVLSGTGAKREQNLEKFLSGNPNKIVIMNYEALQNQAIYSTVYKWAPEVLICDEAHKLKDPQGKRAKLVYILSKLCPHRYILTGTPVLNSYLDVFMPYKILDGGETFGSNYYVFKDRYFKDKNAPRRGTPGYFPDWVFKNEMFQEFQQRLAHRSLQAKKSECLDLPPLTKIKRFVDLSSEQARMYKSMRDEYLTYVRSLTGNPPIVIAQLAITKALRLQQIISGFAKDENGIIHDLGETPRLACLNELLEEIAVKQGSKVIVWAVFKENYRKIGQLCEKLGIKYTELHGGNSQQEKVDNMNTFRNDPDTKVIIANQNAGGVGVNLTEAAYSIYFSKNFSLEQDLQSEARNFRGGSEMHEKITRIDLIAPGTLDELVDEALRQKQNIAEAILNWGEL